MRIEPDTNLLPADDLLQAAYQQLGFDCGALRKTSTTPSDVDPEEWIDRGDWNSLAKQIGAESLFFVKNDPVVVFAKAEDANKDNLRDLYEHIWCMSRPQLLFLATPGQLSAYDLTKSPPKRGEDIQDGDRLIAVAKSVAEVQSELGEYHRERVETGAVFGDSRFRNSLNRADHALIRDLKTVRRQLAQVVVGAEEENLEHLHSLIGRAIFIRYLEDREIIKPDNFEKVARQNREWGAILNQDGPPSIEPRLDKLRFLRVLRNKDFTYALFDRLAEDFNGDTFPVSNEERGFIQQAHLDKLRDFLTAEMSKQQELFFFAYRFNVIPIELISTIYEEFYGERTDNGTDQGSYYTPPALVEFVLKHTLTPEVLKNKPRVLDPACGSGIFLVESFRRMVRYQQAKQNGRRIGRNQLQKILREQIAGIDINKGAVSVAAFSLYLAYLHYQEPRYINQDRMLPHLKVPEDRQHQQTGKWLNILLCANSFEVAEGSYPDEVVRRFGPASVDVVVGNPPWNNPKKTDAISQKDVRKTLKWCEKHECPVSNKDPSQAFIHLTGNLLKEGGKAGLLVSSGVLFNEKSWKFRNVWLNSVQLKHVVNFAHVRRAFFSRSVAPFISVAFEKAKPLSPPDDQFEYWSAKRNMTVENTRSVVLNRGDMHWLSQRDCLAYEKLWKIYWWGGHRDEALVRKLEMNPRLAELPKQIEGAKLEFGRGFDSSSKQYASEWLKDYKVLPSDRLEKYGPQPLNDLDTVPDQVHRRGEREIYSGSRLLVARGIKEKSGEYIKARFETKKYCFYNSIHGVRFHGLAKWQEATVTAVFWSSLIRYYYFATSSSWGFWHNEIHLEHVKNLPIRFPEDDRLRDRIVRVVLKLQQVGIDPLKLGGSSKLPALEQELDEAVFDLYQLNAAERDLVREMCNVGLPMFYQRQGKEVESVQCPKIDTGKLSDVSGVESGLSAYLRIFLENWNREVSPDETFVWRVIKPSLQTPLLAVSFTMPNGQESTSNGNNVAAWDNLLHRLSDSAIVSAGGSRIFLDTFFRYVGEHEIIFIKRNEKRFWTRTAAREDVESVLTHLMNGGLPS